MKPILTHLAIAVAVVVGLLAPTCRCDAWPQLILAMQGLPTIVLLAFVAIAPTNEPPRYRWSIVAAFVLSLVGGFFLGVPGHFTTGVLGYLAANIAYLTAFTTGVRFGQRIIPFLILGPCGATVLALAWPHIPAEHTLPVLLYTAAIVSVPAQAIGRALVMRRIGAVAAAIGATLLLFSDSAIAINRFHAPFQGAGPLIMSTYFIGQWLIAISIGRMKQPSTRDSSNIIGF